MVTDSPHLSQIETNLVKIWEVVLKKNAIESNANFFELGGDSIGVVQVIGRVRDVFQLDYSIQDFFNAPTLAAMAVKIESILAKPSTFTSPAFNQVAREQAAPLSFSQEQMWFIHQLNPTSPAYNIVYAVDIEGELDFEALVRSFNQLANRHATLRTTFPAIDGQPECRIALSAEVRCEKIDLRSLPAQGLQEKTQRLMVAEAARPFDLERGPLTHFVLFSVSENKSILLLSLHHLIFDAWSLAVLLHDLMAYYRAETSGVQPNLPPLQIQYTDYAYWQRQWFQGAILDLHLAYWRARLDGISPLNLPTDRPRPVIQTYNGTILANNLDDDLFNQLQRLAASEGATTFMVGLAAFQLLMRRYTSQADIALGIPVSNRDWLQTEPLIGSLVNTLVIRVDLSENPTFRELLSQVRQVVLDAYTYQNMPFGKLVAELNPTRDPSYSPLVQVVFNMINVPKPELILEHLKINSNMVEVDRRASQFDLTFTIYDVPGFRKIITEYNLDIFDPETIERMADQYLRLLHSIAANPDQQIDAIPLLDEAERRHILEDWNSTQMPLPVECELVQLIRSQALKTPLAPALIASDAALTYKELIRRVDMLSGVLLKEGIRPGERVGLGLQRTSDLVVAPLAVMAVGAAYVPLDPSFPDSRLDWMIENSKLALILTHSGSSDRWPAEIRQIHTDGNHFWNQDGRFEPPASLDEARLAYILYTSGSTGKPKGVAVPQKALVNVLCAMKQWPGIQPSDVVLGITTLSFDISMVELFLPLMYGARLVLASQAEARDGFKLIDLLELHDITYMQATPITWRMLIAAGWQGKSNLRAVCCGEALIADLAEQLLHRTAELWNLYGPTETTIYSTGMQITQEHLKLRNMPIGRPIGNTQVYILDKNLQPVIQGVVGELYIGGAGVANGYYGHPDLTEQRFIRSPFDPAPGARLYRTGDEVRWGNDGQIHFIGRSDLQVKIRGFRIELGEIEAVINLNPRVKQSVVVAQGERHEQMRLIAYYEPAAGSSIEGLVEELISGTRAQLPDYMIPLVFIEIDRLPFTPTGKIDRKALPAYTADKKTALNGYAAPQTDVEIGLAEIWTDILEVKQVGLYDDFFALGGHSLLSVRLIAEIQKRFGLKLPISVLFNSPTIAALARTIEKSQYFSGHPAPATPLVPIQPRGSKTPIYFIHPIGGGVFGYSKLARYLGEDQPIYGLEARPEDVKSSDLLSLEAIAARYLEVVQKNQPQGPYNFGGYSFGGVLAYEMAQQLHAQGQKVGLLAMLDNDAPKSGYDQPHLNWMFVTGFFKNLPYWWNDFWQISTRQRIGRIRRKLFSRPDPSGEADLSDFVDDVAEVPPEYRQLMKKLYQAYDRYQPKPYDGRVTLFRTPRQPLFCSFDPNLGWSQLASGGVDVYPIAGAHRNLLEEPFVAVLAEALQKALNFLAA